VLTGVGWLVAGLIEVFWGEGEARGGGMGTLFVHRKLEIAYAAVGAEDFAEMAFVDVLGQSLDDDLCLVSPFFFFQILGDRSTFELRDFGLPLL